MDLPEYYSAIAKLIGLKSWKTAEEEQRIQDLLNKHLGSPSDQLLLKKVTEIRNGRVIMPKGGWKQITEAINPLRVQQGLDEFDAFRISIYWNTKVAEIRKEGNDGLAAVPYQPRINWTPERAALMVEVVKAYQAKKGNPVKLSKEDWLNIQKQLIERDPSFKNIPSGIKNSIKPLRDAYTTAQKVHDKAVKAFQRKARQNVA